MASVKPNPGCQNKRPQGGTFTPSPDRIEIPCVNLKRLILIAYGTFADGVTIDPQELHMEGGPSWMQSECYSVSAKADAPPAHPQMMLGPMLQALLEDRFRLKTHHEMREMPVYAMTLGKRGLKVQPLAEVACTPIELVHPRPPAKPGELPNNCGVPMVDRTGTGDLRIKVLGATMTQFAQGLSRLAGRTIIERTGVAGRFNFHLEFTPDPGMPAIGPPSITMLSCIVTNSLELRSAEGTESAPSHQPGLDHAENLFPR
ncbi:MAG: TIGR03435 family protein, partial [Terriglobia bacterium]